MQIAVVVTLTFEAVHSWPACDVPGVLYLSHPHRHLFYICCKKQVTGSDREIEIITLKHEVSDYLRKTYPGRDIGTKSCEQLAIELINVFGLKSCMVLEDGENGADVWA
jgi:hypothetical protein